MASIGDINIDDDDDDDDMLDLFSFGADTTTPSKSTNQPQKIKKATIRSPTDPCNKVSNANASVANRGNDDDDNSHASNDSFMELLEHAQHTEISVEDVAASVINGNKNGANKGRGEHKKSESTDMQEILDWLDDDDKKRDELLQRQKQELSIVQPPRPASLKEPIAKADPSPRNPKCSEFDSLEDAVKSRESTKSDIRRLFEKENFDVGPEIRPHLWSKIICEMTLEETMRSSLAVSFQQWEQDYWQRYTTSAEGKSNASNNVEKDENEKKEERLEQDSKKDVEIEEQKKEWLEKQSGFLAERILTVVKGGDFKYYRKALQSILTNHYETTESGGDEDSSDWKDPLIPPVLCAILSSGVPPPVACVMLSQIIPTFMPFLTLTAEERGEAAIILHRQFYLLACYHAPLLVLHLDKFSPGWYECVPNGKIPQSWLMSHLAGETNDAFMNAKWLLRLWDLILSTKHDSLRFFLVIAILDRNAERLLLLTDDDLKEELSRVLSFSWDLNSDDTNVGDNCQSIEGVQEWIDKAILLWKETPISVAEKLKVLEDEAVTKSLDSRQEAKEEKLRLQQEAKEKAEHEAREAEKERKAEEARIRLTRARLVAFYRQYNPGKENNIDKIMKTYEGRYDVLDGKLRLKYGVGFNPALKPKQMTIKMNNKKLFATMNTGFMMSKNKKQEDVNLQPGKNHSVVVQVPVSEVLPVVCWSNNANRIKISMLDKNSKPVNDENGRIPLKFHIVDCRLDAAVKEQGRLPSATSFCPKSSADLKKIKEQETFESLRGSSHICMMSEGYASLPQLYGHKMSSGLAELIREEERRNSASARFFLSKGFPFVSVLEGGFASAHAYLCREGPKIHLNVSEVLVEYNPEVSLFGRFETLHGMSNRDKAQRAVQNLFDSSLTALTKQSMRLESLASDLDNGSADEQKKGPKNAVQRFFSGAM